MGTAPPANQFVLLNRNPAPEGARVVWLEGPRQLKLRALVAPPPDRATARGTVIVCPGRTEFIEKYFEVGRELQAKGFGLLILDWPGQGLSERLLPNILKGHIDRFETFMNSLANGLNKLEDVLPRPHVSLAHSMGGAIALAAIAEGLVQVKAAAFCAPMWGLKSPVAGMKYIVWAMRTVGRQNDFAIKPGPRESFEDNKVTHDRDRWQLTEDLVEAAPGLELGPVTWGWLGASLDIFKRFGKPEKLARVTCPVFVASAAEEALVDNDSHQTIADQLADVEHISVDGARHEILMESDDKRAQFWAGFDRMLERAGV